MFWGHTWLSRTNLWGPWTKADNILLVGWVVTLNLLNHASIICFHSECLKTWLHWNNKIFIDDFIADVMVLTTSMFINMKLHSLIEINFSKIIKCRYEEKTNLYWKVVLSLSLVVSNKWISLWREPLST